jgi:hypothetical protein
MFRVTPDITARRSPERRAPFILAQEKDVPKFTESIVSYPVRGSGDVVDGDPKYPGNCSGRFVEDFLRTYHRDRRGLVVDPMQGSGTTGAVCKRLDLRYRGFDLRTGFDAVRMDLLEALGERAQTIFLHPPYLSVKVYSGNAWGESDARDLSQTGLDIDAFSEMLAALLSNVYGALAAGGTYGVLVGSQRKNGQLFHIADRVMRFAPGTLVDEIIKIQHRVGSARSQYGGPFVRIAHETLLVFRRDVDGTIVAVTSELLGRLQHQAATTWKSLVVGYAREHPALSLDDLYAAFDGHPRAGSNRFWRDKLRQIAGDGETFKRLARGRFALKETVAG